MESMGIKGLGCFLTGAAIHGNVVNRSLESLNAALVLFCFRVSGNMTATNQMCDTSKRLASFALD